MAKASLTISSRNYSSWCLRGWLICKFAGLEFEAEMCAAKVDWQMILYGNTGHSFTNPGADAMKRPGFFYQPLSDARSWAQMRAFLEEIFAGCCSRGAPSSGVPWIPSFIRAWIFARPSSGT